jgi:hypothetical protein
MDSKGIEGLEDGRSEARDRDLSINSESYGTLAFSDVVLMRHLLWGPYSLVFGGFAI